MRFHFDTNILYFLIFKENDKLDNNVQMLHILGDHRDPNDRLIIAQGISDNIPLISSDLKLSRYEKYGLDFILNER